MSRTVIIYRSKYGATKRYAQWLGEMLHCDVLENNRLKPEQRVLEQLAPYDTVVLGGGVYAGGIAGASFLKKNSGALRGKRVAVFAVGASPEDKEAMRQMRERCLNGLPEELQAIPLFYCRGAWSMSRMNWLDRTMCGMLKKSVAKQDAAAAEPWQKALMEAEGDCDWTDKNSLEPIVRFVENRA